MNKIMKLFAGNFNLGKGQPQISPLPQAGSLMVFDNSKKPQHQIRHVADIITRIKEQTKNSNEKKNSENSEEIIVSL